MDKDLISLDEHNKIRHNITFPEYPMLNGIACPKCGEEMYDTNSNVLCSYPPKKNVHCEKCRHRDYALI